MRSSAVGGVVYLFQHDLKRLLALHSIENVGIIVLGIGACLILRARGADEWAAFALAAALLHLNHAVFKALLFLGAVCVREGCRLARARPPRRPSAARALDRRRVLRRRDGDRRAAAAERLRLEWLTLQALLHVPAYGGVGGGIAGAAALAALAATAALAVCFVKVVGLVLLGPPRRAATATEAPVEMRAAVVLARRRVCRYLGLAPGLLWIARRTGAVAGRGTNASAELPERDRCPPQESPSRSSSSRQDWSCCVAIEVRRPHPPGPAGSSWSLACGGRAPASRSLRLAAKVVLRPQREIVVRETGGVLQEVSYSGNVRT